MGKVINGRCSAPQLSAAARIQKHESQNEGDQNRSDESNGVRKEEEHGCEPLEAPTSDLPYLFALDFLELDLRSFAIPVFRVVAILWAAVRGDPLLEPALSSERLESGNRSAARVRNQGANTICPSFVISEM
jgi:hypothetical protein